MEFDMKFDGIPSWLGKYEYGPPFRFLDDMTVKRFVNGKDVVFTDYNTGKQYTNKYVDLHNPQENNTIKWFTTDDCDKLLQQLNEYDKISGALIASQYYWLFGFTQGSTELERILPVQCGNTFKIIKDTNRFSLISDINIKEIFDEKDQKRIQHAKHVPKDFYYQLIKDHILFKARVGPPLGEVEIDDKHQRVTNNFFVADHTIYLNPLFKNRHRHISDIELKQFDRYDYDETTRIPPISYRNFPSYNGELMNEISFLQEINKNDSAINDNQNWVIGKFIINKEVFGMERRILLYRLYSPRRNIDFTLLINDNQFQIDQYEETKRRERRIEQIKKNLVELKAKQQQLPRLGLLSDKGKKTKKSKRTKKSTRKRKLLKIQKSKSKK
jgi:hypothetical protein